MLRDWWERLSRVEAGSSAGQITYLAMIMAVTTLISLVLSALMLNWVPLMAAGLGWVFVGVFALMQTTLFHRTGKAVASITLPSGGTTPSVAQHSNVEAMEMRGDYRGAAEAYQAAIAADPHDVVACEKLGRLAMAELKDYHLAVVAYREAAKRVTEPRRQLGYELLVAGIYRDNLKDIGRTIVEYRRILEQWPAAPNAADLRADLEQLKARHFEGA